MAKKPAYTIAEVDLKKLPRNEQRRLKELGYVVATKAEAKKAAEAK